MRDANASERYRAAARERLTDAGECYRAGRYVACHYLCGLAVECLLRAYRTKTSLEFDERHELYLLYRDSFARHVPQSRSATLYSDIIFLATLWSNGDRYATDSFLRKRMVRHGRFRKVRGNVMKEAARQVYNAAERVVTLGEQLWTISPKN